MRCYYEPPLAHYLATVKSRIEGAPPVLIVAGLTPEVHPARFCRHHPLLREGGSPGYGAGSTN